MGNFFLNSVGIFCPKHDYKGFSWTTIIKLFTDQSEVNAQVAKYFISSPEWILGKQGIIDLLSHVSATFFIFDIWLFSEIRPQDYSAPSQVTHSWARIELPYSPKNSTQLTDIFFVLQFFVLFLCTFVSAHS